MAFAVLEIARETNGAGRKPVKISGETETQTGRVETSIVLCVWFPRSVNLCDVNHRLDNS
jgi:hypothetical protein